MASASSMFAIASPGWWTARGRATPFVLREESKEASQTRGIPLYVVVCGHDVRLARIVGSSETRQAIRRSRSGSRILEAGGSIVVQSVHEIRRCNKML